MPAFLQTSFLVGLAALAVPVLIHLFFRLRTKRVELGTIRFLRVVLEENARRRKVMRWFLLALRMACVALLVALFARPYFTSAAAGGDKELLVLLLDQSATMQLKGDNGRLFDQAVASAKQVVQKTSQTSRVEIALFDDSVRPLRDEANSESKRSPYQLLSEIKSEPVLFGGTNYGVAFAWARDILTNSPSGSKQLHLWTDLQRSGLDWTEVDPLPGDVEVHLHDLGRPIVNNVAVTEVRSPRTWIHPDDTAHVQASVVHTGAFTLEEVTVVLEIGKSQNEIAPATPESSVAAPLAADFAKLSARITKRERVKLVPGSTVTLDFDLPQLSEGLWVGRITIEYDDDLGFDNRRYFAIAAAPAHRVLVVKEEETDNPLLSETYFLEAALRLAGPGESFADNPFAPEVVAYAASGLPDLATYDAVVLANVPNVSAEDAARLAAFVRSGRGLLLFTGDRVSDKNCETLQNAGLSVGKIGETQITRDLPWRLGQWDEKHPVFQELSDPQHGDLRQLIFAAYTKIAVAPEAKVVAEFRTGDPAVLERNLGKGTILWVTTSCGRDWSNWSGTRLFLPIVHQLIGYQVGLTAGGRVRSRLVAEEQKLEKPTSKAEQTKVVPTAQTASVMPGILQYERFAEVINVSPRESETETSTRKDFEDRFGIQFVESDGSTSVSVKAPQDVEFRPDEVWHWIACLILGVVLLEGFVGNRTTA
jgi:hypothetical protein